ncbi:MAG: DNA sulfur modification protein DndB [Deltaproteobacteria bacterium]|nr:DNA sulfur modification protein DndB [Deltaproteobacteria bacterium]
MTVEYYSFLVIRGNQGDYAYYLTHCPLRLVPRLFLFDEIEVPAELRQLHLLNSNRVTKLTEYLVNQPDEYILAPLVASIDSDVKFEALSDELPDAGQLRVPLSARLIIHDGQHRREAIAHALTQSQSLGNDTIPIMLIPDSQFFRSVRLYSDLNQPHQKGRTQSQRILHDHDNPVADLVRQLVEEIPIFKGLTELEKTTISNRSAALFTLSAIYQATQAFLGVGKHEPMGQDQSDLVRQFWKELGQIISEWNDVIEGKLKSAKLRQNYVHAHGVTLLAIGHTGHTLVTQYPDDWPERLLPLDELDWSRENTSLWEGRAMVRGRMSKARDSVLLTANVLKKSLGLSLTDKEQSLEEQLLASN